MKIFERGELKILWPFYLDHLISPMLFFFPAFFILYLKELSFTIFQISILISIIPLFSLLSEIPTGAVADLYGRKFSVLISLISSFFIMLALYFAQTFYTIAFLFALEGISISFSSGAKEAWTVDLIKKNKKITKSYFTKASSLDSLGLIISGILGAIIVGKLGLRIIWLFAASSFLVALLFLFFAKENHTRKKYSIKNSFLKVKSQTRSSLSYSYNHHVVFWFFAASAFLVVAGYLGGMISWTILLQKNGMSDASFGYLWSAMSAAGVLGPIVTQLFMKPGKERKFILLFVILSALFTLALLFSPKLIFSVSILLAISFISFCQRPAERIFFHRFLPSKMRATIGSIEGMLFSLLEVLVVPFTGLLIEAIGARSTILLGIIFIIPAAIIYYTIKEPLPKH